MGEGGSGGEGGRGRERVGEEEGEGGWVREEGCGRGRGRDGRKKEEGEGGREEVY